MPPRRGEKVNQRVEIPETVLDRRGRQHQHKRKAPCGQRLLKALCYLRPVRHTKEIAKLVCLIEDQHLEAVLGNLYQIKARRIVGRDDGTCAFGIGR